MVKKVESLDLSKYLGTVRNRIYRVGVELEGGWAKLPAGTELTRDGSVSVPAPCDENGVALRIAIGELPSPPLEPIKVKSWMKKFYPSHVNETCGLHVHMSFEEGMYYQWLMTLAYQKTMMKYLQKWAKDEKQFEARHPIFTRLQGENQYCKDEFWADVQAGAASKSYSHFGAGNRYTIINYCHGIHETIECRVLPMMNDWETAYEAVRQVMDITNASLVALAANEKKLEVTVSADRPIVEYSEY